MISHRIILASSQELTPKAQALAESLSLPMHTSIPDNATHALLVREDGLALQALKPEPMNPIRVDFCDTHKSHRLNPQQWRQELIARACGFKQNKAPRLLDATGGFGDDAFVLASLGAHVTLLERVPIMHALLADALELATKQEIPGALCMQLKQADARDYLSTTTESYDVIFLDPMYPDPDKRALVKKRCRIIRDLVGDDHDADDLLALALQKAPRVVVKRPRLAPPLANIPTKDSLAGKAVRFDIYLNPTLKEPP